VTPPLRLSFSHPHAHHPALPSFPTRRSSDLATATAMLAAGDPIVVRHGRIAVQSTITTSTLQSAVAHAAKDEATLGQKGIGIPRSEEHTSELQSRFDLVCRLLLEKKKKQYKR